MSKLLNLKRNKGAVKKKKTVGRGNGSGHGTYSTRGGNGQTARTGGGVRPGFIGGQTPIYRKMPKLGGFTSINRVEYQAINLSTLDTNFTDGEIVNAETLHSKGLIRDKAKKIKLLANGELKRKLTIVVNASSKVATEKAKESKSTVELI